MKTRTLAGCAVQLGVGTYYDIFKQEWIKVNDPQPTLYITSEQEYQEIQTLNMAFISGVSEDKILDGMATPEEEERIFKAIELIKNGKLYIEPIGDYGIRPLINLIKRYKQTKDISYVCHDYLHSSLTLMNEISSEARISNLREDQMLLMLCNSLKNACNQLNIFVFTATQLNRTYKEEEKMDATVIRGAISIVDKLDFGSVLMDLEEKELLMIKKLLENNTNMMIPNVVTHIYKNRRSKYNSVKLYSYLDKGTGQILDLFVLDSKNQIVDIKPTQIIQQVA